MPRHPKFHGTLQQDFMEGLQVWQCEVILNNVCVHRFEIPKGNPMFSFLTGLAKSVKSDHSNLPY